MLKKELVAELATRTNLAKADIERVLAAQDAIVTQVACQGGELIIPGICKLSVVDKAERVARNPRTGEQVTVPAHKALKFKALLSLKEALNPSV